MAGEQSVDYGTQPAAAKIQSGIASGGVGYPGRSPLPQMSLDRDREAALLFAKDLFQQRRDLSRGVFADLLFFLAHHVEDPIERFADHVFVEVEIAAGVEAGGPGGLPELVVLLFLPPLFH